MNSPLHNGPSGGLTGGAAGGRPWRTSVQPGSLDPSKLDSSGAQGTGLESGSAFQDLLADLQTKAVDLQSSSKSVVDPAQLRGAVEQARATLQDALSLGGQVLEAFRGARVVGASDSQAAQGNTRIDPAASSTDDATDHTIEHTAGSPGPTGELR